MAQRHPVVVLGAGAWGTALAIAAAARQPVLLWARDAAQATRMQIERGNTRYLPGQLFPDALTVTADAAQVQALAADGLAVLGTPMAGLRPTLAMLPQGARALWLCKGFEADTGALGHEIAAPPGPTCAAACCRAPALPKRWRAASPPPWWPPAPTRN